MVNLISTMIFPWFSHEQRMDSRNNWQNMGNLGHCWTPSVQKLCTMSFHICSLKFGIWTRQLQLLRQTNQFVSCLVYYPTTSKFNDQQKTLSDPLQSPWQTVWTQYFDDIKSHRDAIDVLHQKTNVNSLAQWNSTTLIGPCRLDNTFFLANKLWWFRCLSELVSLSEPCSRVPFLSSPCLWVFVNLNEWNFNWFRNLGYVDEFAVKDRQQFSAKDSDLSRFNIRTTKY